MYNKKSDFIQPTNNYRDITSMIRNGFILTLFTIDFMSLAYIIPFIGICCMLYGCYLIKEQNIYFRRSYYLVWIRLALMLINFLLDWTQFYNNELLTLIQILFSSFVICAFIYYLDFGFYYLYTKYNLSTYKHPLNWYIVLYLGNLTCLALIFQNGPLGGLLSLIVIIINVIYLIISLNHIGTDLSYTKELIQEKTVSNKCIAGISFGFLFYICLVILVVQVTNKGLFIESNVVTNNTLSKESTLIQDNLIQAGMPEYIADNLPSEELQYYEDITQIDSNMATYNYDGALLNISFYRIQLKGNNQRLLCYYMWEAEPDCRFFDILECDFDGTWLEGSLTAACLYEDDENQTYSIPMIESGKNENDNPYVKIKLPDHGTNLRGYLSFNIKDITLIPSQCSFNYYHQHSIFNLPYTDITHFMNDYDSLLYNTIFDRKQVYLEPIKKVSTTHQLSIAPHS